MVAFILFGYLTAIRQAFDAGVEVAGVVAVMVGDNNAIVLRSGADSEMMSGLGGDETRIIAEAPGIARDASGAATLNWASFSAITFAFDVNIKLLTQGIIFAMLIGLIGGLFPAIRAARQPVAYALREL